MRWCTSCYVFLPSITLAAFSDVVPTRECPILGPTFPSGFDLTDSDAIRAAKHEFPALIQSLYSSGTIDPKQSSFTIDVFSTAANESLYSYAHAASDLTGELTAGVLNDGTIFRIGSVSKLYTAYAIIAQAGIAVLDHPVTRYLPELAGNSPADSLNKIIWEDVTVGALASQQGGSGGIRRSLSPLHQDYSLISSSQLSISPDVTRWGIAPFQVCFSTKILHQLLTILR